MALTDPLNDDLPPELAVDFEPFSDEFLDAALTEAAETGQAPTPATLSQWGVTVSNWHITDEELAEWACRKLRAADDEYRRRELQKAAWQERIEAWWVRAARPLERRREFFRAHLEHYLARRREEDPRLKSLALPSGTIKSRAAGPKVVVQDPAAVIAWAEANGKEGVVRVVQSVAAAELKKAVEVKGGRPIDPETGEVVPGLVVEPATTTYWVQPS